MNLKADAGSRGGSTSIRTKVSLKKRDGISLKGAARGQKDVEYRMSRRDDSDRTAAKYFEPETQNSCIGSINRSCPSHEHRQHKSPAWATRIMCIGSTIYAQDVCRSFASAAPPGSSSPYPSRSSAIHAGCPGLNKLLLRVARRGGVAVVIVVTAVIAAPALFFSSSR